MLIDPLDRSRLVDPVNLPCPAADELELEAIVVLGHTAMAESGRGGGASREHRANPRSVGSDGGVCGGDKPCKFTDEQRVHRRLESDFDTCGCICPYILRIVVGINQTKQYKS